MAYPWEHSVSFHGAWQGAWSGMCLSRGVFFCLQNSDSFSEQYQKDPTIT